MVEVFDPYLKWFGIPAVQQPPNPYRLLGIELFESDVEVIDNAADRQMAHLRTHQSGAHRADCQRLLNEVSSARVSLLDEQRRGAIDRRLRAQMAANPPAPLKVARPLEPANPQPSSKLPSSKLPNSKQPNSKQPSAAQTARPIPVAAPRPIGAGLATAAASVPDTPAADRLRNRRSKNVPLEIAKVAAGAIIGLLVAVLVLNFAMGVDLLGIFGQPASTAATDPLVPNPATDPLAQPSDGPPSDVGASNVPPRLPAEPNPFKTSVDDGTPTVADPAEPEPWTEQHTFFGVRDRAPTTASDLRRALQNVSAQIPVFDGAFTDPAPDDADRRAKMVHDAFCNLGAVLAVCDYSHADVQQQGLMVNEVLNAVADRQQKLQMLSRLAGERMKQPGEDGDGLFVCGRVVQIEGHSRLYRTRVELLAPSPQAVEIYTWRDPATLVSVGDTVFVLGMIVQDPDKNLAGYEGATNEKTDTEFVYLWGGFLMRLKRG